MAIVKCRECGADVSDEAAACPKCGAKPHMTAGARVFWVLAALFVLVFLAYKATTGTV